LTLTATLPAALFASRTGSIQFLDNGTVLGTVPLTATASTFTIPSLAVGPHTFTAVYSGDDNFVAATTKALRISVRKANTTIALNQPIVNEDQSVTLSAELPALAVGTPTGLVIFKAGTRAIGTVTLGSPTGLMTPTITPTLTTSLSAGTYSLTAVYSGDGRFNPAASLRLVTTITATG
jgi:hypothetical protein